MKILWCWRCKREVPMLDEDEYKIINELYGKCMKNARGSGSSSINSVFEPVIKEYERLTGMVNCHHNIIMHHRLSIYGPACKECGKPLRTPKSKICMACGKKVNE